MHFLLKSPCPSDKGAYRGLGDLGVKNMQNTAFFGILV